MFYCRLDNAILALSSLLHDSILVIYLYYLYFILFILPIYYLLLYFINFEILCNNNNKYPIIYFKINDTLSNLVDCWMSDQLISDWSLAKEFDIEIGQRNFPTFCLTHIFPSLIPMHDYNESMRRINSLVVKSRYLLTTCTIFILKGEKCQRIKSLFIVYNIIRWISRNIPNIVNIYRIFIKGNRFRRSDTNMQQYQCLNPIAV